VQHIDVVWNKLCLNVVAVVVLRFPGRGAYGLYEAVGLRGEWLARAVGVGREFGCVMVVFVGVPLLWRSVSYSSRVDIIHVHINIEQGVGSVSARVRHG
jgi:hypothetical protein